MLGSWAPGIRVVLPLGDDGLGHVLGAVVSLLHQPPDLLRGKVKGQRSGVSTVSLHADQFNGKLLLRLLTFSVTITVFWGP